MPLPDRPAAGADIEPDWGQDVHDRVFAPKGGEFSGVGTTIVTAGQVALDLSVAVSDPGGWHDAANDRVEVPAGAEGLYIVGVRTQTSGGGTGDTARLLLQLNGVVVAHNNEDLETSVVTPNTIAGLVLHLTAGDLLLAAGKRIGSAGGAPSMNVESMTFVRIGDDYGA